MALDDLLWVMAPGLEIVHPGSAGLNDLQFFECLIPVTVRPTDDVLGLLVGRFDVSQWNLLLTVGQDSVKMFFNHSRKALERLHPAPLQGVDPFPEELHRPSSGFVFPKMTEGLLEEVRFEKAWTHKKEFLQSLSALTLQIGPPGQENELLATQKSFHPGSQFLELLLPDLIDRLEEVPDHMELVVNDLGRGTMGQKALPKGLPHVHHAVGDETGPVFPEPGPEGLQALLFASFYNVQEFRASRTFQGADHGPVRLPLSDGDLVEPQDGNAFQRSLRLDLLHHRLVDVPDRPPVKSHQDPDRLVRHDLAQLVDEAQKGLCDTRPPKVHEVQRFRPDPAVRTTDPITLEAHNGEGLPPHQMTDFPFSAVISRETRFSALSAPMCARKTLEGDDHNTKSAPVFDPDIADLKSFKIQKSRDKFIGHPVSPPCSHLAMDTRKKSYLTGCLFSPTLSRQEPINIMMFKNQNSSNGVRRGWH